MKIQDDTGRLDEPVDLTNCDKEPIHLLGRVQSFGALVALSSDWLVKYASQNIVDFLGLPADDMIGLPFAQMVTEDFLQRMRQSLAIVGDIDSLDRHFGLTVREDCPPFDVAIHQTGDVIVIEFERHDINPSRDYAAHIRPLIKNIEGAQSVEELCEAGAAQLRDLIGFDRVMVYKFAPDNSGIVVADSHKLGMESFKGLRYPATDIPSQARTLYKRNLLRIISDVKDEGSPILPPQDARGQPLDLSLSTTRAVSPIHTEYLTNMGVDASLSISIIKRGKLWGLFACHHESPRVLPFALRTAAELFGQLFAFSVEQQEADKEREETLRAQRVHDQLMAQLAEGSSIADNFNAIVAAVSKVISFDGAACWVDGQFEALGKTPTREEFLGLIRFLNTLEASRVYETDNISKFYPKGEDFASRAAGLLVLPVSRTPRDYIVLFRREITRAVTWAGNPNKPVEVGPHGDRLTPRKSFEAWQETVSGTSAPWTETEVRAAESLRVTLLEVVLRMADAAIKERERASEQQELLIAELNHRVRNILGLIRSLVNQSRAEAKSVSEFTEVVGGRVHALARAHDQITQKQWNPASAHDLVLTEAEAYLADKADRLRLIGRDVLLEPAAFTTMSLVVHELITNAAKYGALCDKNGSIEITFEQSPDDGVSIRWKEMGGPPIIQPPKRRGFGSTIIERSIPVELKGRADIRFETAGFEADFHLPAHHVAKWEEPSASPKTAPRPARDDTAKDSPLSGKVLVVEDNMIIALDASEMLEGLGAAEVLTAASPDEALALIDKHDFTFALLDVNLKTETSEPVADRLTGDKVPFIFATGYGEQSVMLKRFPEATVIQKPYEASTIRQVLKDKDL